MASIKQLGKDSAIYGFGTALQRIIGFILLPFYTRALVPSEYGLLDALATFSFFATTILDLGLTGATGRYYFIAKTEDEKGSVLYTSLIMRIISFSLPLLVLILFSSQISNLLFKTTEYKYVVAISLATIFMTSMFNIQSVVFRYNRDAWKFTLVNTIRTIIAPTSGILLVVILQWGVLGAVSSQFITSTVMVIFAYFYYTRNKYVRNFSWQWAKKMLKFGIPLIFAGIIGWINAVSDRFFLLHYADLEQIGLYAIGSKFAQPISLINMALTMSISVLVMSLFSEEEDENKPKTKLFLTKVWHYYFFVSITLATLISIFSYEIVNFVTTPKYITGILVIPFLSFSMIINQSTQITGNGMTLMEKSKPYFWIVLIAASVNVGLNFYFIPHFGFVGAAFTTVFSNFVYFIIAYIWSQKYFYITRSFSKPLFYFCFSLALSCFFPFAQLKFGLEIALWVKLLVFSGSLLLPFVLGIIEFEMVKSNLINVYNKFKSKNSIRKI